MRYIKIKVAKRPVSLPPIIDNNWKYKTENKLITLSATVPTFVRQLLPCLTHGSRYFDLHGLIHIDPQAVGSLRTHRHVLR